MDTSGRQRAYLDLQYHNNYSNLLTDLDPTMNNSFTIINLTEISLSTGMFDNIGSRLNKFPQIKAYNNLLPYVSLWQDQNQTTKNNKFVSQLSVKFDRYPALLPSAIDCYIGIQCHIYQANFSLFGNCADADQNRKYITNISLNNQTRDILPGVNLYKVGQLSDMQVNISFKQNSIYFTGIYNISVSYFISDNNNQWPLITDLFTLNISNGCVENYKVIEPLKLPNARRLIQTDPVYFQIQKAKLSPYQECYVQRLLPIFSDVQYLQGAIIQDQLDQLMIGVTTRYPDFLGKHQLPIEVQVWTDQNGILLEKYRIIFEFEVYQDFKPSLNNTAPYFVFPINDIEIKVGETRVVDLPKIIDDEGDSYEVKVETKMGSLFIVYSNTNIIVKPSEAVIGIHQVVVIIEDNNLMFLRFMNHYSKVQFYMMIIKKQRNFESQEWDRMVVNFKMYFLFYDATEKLMMKEGYQIKFQIPPQMSQSLENQISNLGTATAISLSSVVGSNIIINILMQFISFLNIIGLKVYRCFGG
ncbi:UNKNOWN [Stylonychia lemnae]|uniref:Uncharacterized protein n=1 Tax=Stylonychia lemnae TaxID=5949 RepID=A0A078B7N4_STYLE|nr:UNKNOWN [Stylonychia lemnae]|eukprot:CDW89568.1 UNKNOWN [Stylonychia lemnae]